MKYQDLTFLFQRRPYFEAGELDIWFDEPPKQIRARLSRWVRGGKLIQLRRGHYLLPEEHRFGEPSDGYISNYLYRPSYISLFSAMELYGLIPERVGVIEAVTPRQTARWDTPIGILKYFSIKENKFWGYTLQGNKRQQNFEQQGSYVAHPEKALLDLFYFQKGEWSINRILEMRFQNLNVLDINRLKKYSDRFNIPKVSRAIKNFVRFFEMET